MAGASYSHEFTLTVTEDIEPKGTYLVFLVGSTPEFGEWKYENGIPLTLQAAANGSSQWSVKLDLSESPMQYRYFIKVPNPHSTSPSSFILHSVESGKDGQGRVLESHTSESQNVIKIDDGVYGNSFPLETSVLTQSEHELHMRFVDLTSSPVLNLLHSTHPNSPSTLFPFTLQVSNKISGEPLKWTGTKASEHNISGENINGTTSCVVQPGHDITFRMKIEGNFETFIKQATVLLEISVNDSKLLISRNQLCSMNGSTMSFPVSLANSVAEITFEYYWVTGYTSNFANISRSKFPSLISSKFPLWCGHRGFGAHSTPIYSKELPENTIAAFVAAEQWGANFVEFDVQLSHDRVPFVYHNYITNVNIKKKCTKKLIENEIDAKVEEDSSLWNEYDLNWETNFENYDILINKLNLRQIEDLSLNFSDAMTNPKIDDLPLEFHRSKLRSVVKKVVLLNKQLNNKKKPTKPCSELEFKIPTLKEVLLNVPETLGFNVEIKFPVPMDGMTLSDALYANWENKNVFVDKILDVIFANTKDRPIYFSCFDPEVCVLLRRKQSRWPVMFLTTSGVVDTWGYCKDARCNSLEYAIRFAKSEGLCGVVAYSSPLRGDGIKWVDLAKQEGLSFATWGRDNNFAKLVKKQVDASVDVVITDNLWCVNQFKGMKSIKVNA